MTRLPRRPLLAAAILAPFAPGSAMAARPDRPGARRYSFTRPQHRIDWGGSIIEVCAPMQDVMRQVLRYRDYHTILPRMKTSQVLEKHGDEAKVYLRAPILRGLASVWGVTLFKGPLPWKWGGEQVVASLVQGNVHAFEGIWKLHPCRGGTVLRLEMLIDVKVPVPRSIVTDQIMWATDQAVTAVRDMVEDGDSSVKDG
jgi:hypothetical protein